MKAPTLVTSLSLTALLLAGCGEYQKNPVTDLDQMREQGKTQAKTGTPKPQVITETVIVEKPVEVIKEQTTINENFIVISADSDMNFTEGQPSTFVINGRSLIKGVGIRLAATGLPDGAVFQAAPTAQDKDRYTLTWAPSYNTVPYNTGYKSLKFKVSAQITEVPAGYDRKALEALTRQKELSVLVLKNQAAPTELAVNLPASVNADTTTKFDVTVRVLGVDNKSGQKPMLVVRYDGLSVSQGNNFLELDGSRHVVADANNKEPQYLGDYKWKFSLVFDTKNISVQPALDAKGSPLANAEVANVRLSIKAFAPTGSSTPELVKQVKIVLPKPVAAPVVTTPAATAGATK